MRERVTEHIPAAEVPYQLKLGPGGIRDIEFTVQLLQLVHGLSDDRIRQRGTLEHDRRARGTGLHRPATPPPSRTTTACCVSLEHRVQLRQLRPLAPT